LEACGCFVWIFDLLVEELGRAQVHVAQPGKMEVIGKSQEKDDASDAWWLAYELYERRLPEAFVAEGQLRELRIAVRELRWCTDARSDQLRRFLSHWAQMGGQVSRGWHVSKAKRAPVREMVKQVQGERGRALRRLYNMILRQTREMRYWRRRVEELSRGFSEIAKMEEQMPGLGLVTASAVYAELGPAQRFKSAKAYAKATGLTPGYRITAGKVRGRVITKAGSRLARWALTRSALSCLRCRQGSGAQVKYWMVKRMKSKPRKKVLVAVARKLGEGIWRLFNFAEGFQLEKAFPVRGPREGQAEKEPRRVFVLTDRRLEGPAQGRGVASPRGVGQCLEPGQLPTVATAAARPVS
jgi:hypothetical protein